MQGNTLTAYNMQSGGSNIYKKPNGSESRHENEREIQLHEEEPEIEEIEEEEMGFDQEEFM